MKKKEIFYIVSIFLGLFLTIGCVIKIEISKTIVITDSSDCIKIENIIYVFIGTEFPFIVKLDDTWVPDGYALLLMFINLFTVSCMIAFILYKKGEEEEEEEEGGEEEDDEEESIS